MRVLDQSCELELGDANQTVENDNISNSGQYSV